MTDQRLHHAPEGIGIWEHFTIQDGLPEMKIESLFVDSRGDLWIGTHSRGVARFDGDRFEVFTRREGAGNGIFSILEDREGALWVGTGGSMLVRYRDGKFESVVPHSGELYGFLWGRCVDREGTLWFSLEVQPDRPSPAVCRWDGRNLDLLPVTDASDPQRLVTIHQIVVDASGDLWFGGYGLYRYDGEAFHAIAGSSIDQLGVISSLIPRTDGTLWVGSEKGLFVYDEGQFYRIGKGVVDCGVQAMIEDSRSTVWLVTADGRLIHYEGAVFILIRTLGTSVVRQLCFNRTGQLWVGTWGDGLYSYDTTRFQIFQSVHGLPEDEVRYLAEDTSGRVWVGTSSGIVWYNGERFQALEGSEDLTDRYITAMLVDRRNRLWIGMQDGNLYMHDGETLHPVPEAFEQGRGTMSSSISSLTEDIRGRIWFGFRFGYGFGYVEEDRQVRRFPPSAAYPLWIGALLGDRHGGMWIGSWNPSAWGGLCHYDGEYFTAFTTADGLIEGGIYALCEDRESHLWPRHCPGVMSL